MAERVHKGDFQIDRIQRNSTDDLARKTVGTPTNGRQVDDITTKTGEFTVNHGLGRLPKGFFVTNQSGKETVWKVNSDRSTLTLKAEFGDITISLWVY